MRVFIGHDPREQNAYDVAVRSMLQHASGPVFPAPISSTHLRQVGLYKRDESLDAAGRLWCNVSQAPMATQFSNARFFAAHLACMKGWVMFVDCDFLFRADVHELWGLADSQYAVMVVKHQHNAEPGVKMDNQVQTAYPRKNWSSLMLINCEHPELRCLTLEYLNATPGRDLHRFAWLPDEAIGDLPLAWNWLEGISDSAIEPKAVHFTRGIPSMPGYEHSQYAEEWFHHARRAA